MMVLDYLEYWVILYQLAITLGLLAGRVFLYLHWVWSIGLLLSFLAFWFWWYSNFGEPRPKIAEVITKTFLLPAFLVAWILALLR